MSKSGTGGSPTNTSRRLSAFQSRQPSAAVPPVARVQMPKFPEPKPGERAADSYSRREIYDSDSQSFEMKKRKEREEYKRRKPSLDATVNRIKRRGAVIAQVKKDQEKLAKGFEEARKRSEARHKKNRQAAATRRKKKT